MIKRFVIAAAGLLLACGFAAKADDGMWLPSLISQRIEDMQSKGFKLSAEDIYSVNQASLKDAVVLFGSGCTGEIVSADGLLLTNHHCGYSMIQSHSSVEHDYLKDGFWAMNSSEELKNPGLTVKILDRMEDVTSAVLNGWSESMSEAQRDSIVKLNSAAIKKAAVESGNSLKASVEALYYGNQYFLFVYKEYRDIRLVGAPPSSIGKFGGDTDNWMWPRHTGDFSMFRIYVGKDNEPADVSDSNVPYHPRRFLKISTQGVKEGDFTMVFGFPGSTQEYIHSSSVSFIGDVSDPAKIDLRTRRLNIMNKYMSASQKVRIQYSAKYARVSNAWKKWQGESKGLAKNNVVGAKKEYEARFEQWAKGTPYEGVTMKLASLYSELEKFALAVDYYKESAATIEIASAAASWFNAKGTPNLDGFYKDYYLPIDKECFVAVMNVFDEKMPSDMLPEWYLAQRKKYGSIEKWADQLFGKSAFRSKETCAKATKKDPAYQLQVNMDEWYKSALLPRMKELTGEITLLYRLYVKGQMEFEPSKDFFPDANLTLRVAYGKVSGYAPVDAVWYNPVSTLKGIIEKDNPEIFDYNIPQKLRDIYAQGGHEDQPVCFLATNHTTGGNSGSPVLNADGELIGLNFDRVWEGTMSDIFFDPEICRNITLDIRYLLFLVKEVGGAQWLVDEMLAQ
ncbi:MAG: S46 family peptidase [Bacteroidales bacterium]|nr:S46 family peptidase [Candidatus Cryptobacteroides faecihippi]MCQ2162281.1 S46 family peptidase [Bacteroidales bacterium]